MHLFRSYPIHYSNVLEIPAASIFRVKYEPKVGGGWFLQNFVACLQNHRKPITVKTSDFTQGLYTVNPPHATSAGPDPSE
jgi:hypothetical protein